MNADELIAALSMPPGARVDQRVPKKLLVENGAPTVADKRRINEGIDEAVWVATLKPTTIGVPEFRDEAREYLEIAVINASLRAPAKTARLAELIHRAIPYPVLLIATQGTALTLSLAHKRRSQGAVDATVLDGGLVVAEGAATPKATEAFVKEMAVARQPHTNLFALYQGWMDAVVALLAAQRTGSFSVASSPEMAEERRAALTDCKQLEMQMARLRTTAAKSRQIARRVDLNLEIKRLQAEHSAAYARLDPPRMR